MPGEDIPLLIIPRFPLFPYHNRLCKELVVLLYHEDNFGIGYN